MEEQKRVGECQFQIRLGCSSAHSIHMVKLFFLFFQHLHICLFWCNTWLITTNTGKHWMIWSARVSGSHQKTTTDTKSRKPDLLLYQFHCESLTETLSYKGDQCCLSSEIKTAWQEGNTLLIFTLLWILQKNVFRGCINHRWLSALWK